MQPFPNYSGLLFQAFTSFAVNSESIDWMNDRMHSDLPLLRCEACNYDSLIGYINAKMGARTEAARSGNRRRKSFMMAARRAGGETASRGATRRDKLTPECNWHPIGRCSARDQTRKFAEQRGAGETRNCITEDEAFRIVPEETEMERLLHWQALGVHGSPYKKQIRGTVLGSRWWRFVVVVQVAKCRSFNR